MKEINFNIKRISANEFIVNGNKMNYLEMVTWFKDLMASNK